MNLIRNVIYATNGIESLNANLRKLTRNRKIFPNDESVFKAMCLAIQQCAGKWKDDTSYRPSFADRVSLKISLGRKKLRA
jgi:transposase-like protein